MFALIREELVVELRPDLEGSWENISNFGALPEENLRELGWLPVSYPDLTANQKYSEVPTLFADHVEFAAIDLTPEEITAICAQSIPAVITRRQAKLVLLQYGLLDAVESVVATMPRAAQIEYADALSFERSNPLMGMVADAAGMTTEQVDAMFVAGALL